MNERIKELLLQATTLRGPFIWFKVDQEKFAELIVAEATKALWSEECMTSDLALEEYRRNSNKIKDHFDIK